MDAELGKSSPENVSTPRPGGGSAVGSESHSQLNPPKAIPSFKNMALRALTALGIISAGSFGVAKGVEQVANIVPVAANTAVEAKNQIGLLPEQRGALALYEMYKISNPERILKNMVIVNPQGRGPVNGRNMPDVEKSSSIIYEAPVGTVLGDVIEVEGIDADLLPDIREKLRQSSKPEDKQRLKAKWYFEVTNDGKDGRFFFERFVKKADLAQLNPLNKDYPAK